MRQVSRELRFGANVRRARLRLARTQETLAEEAGVSSETVSRIERGAFEPSLSTAVAIAAALGVPIGRLLDGDGRKRSR